MIDQLQMISREQAADIARTAALNSQLGFEIDKVVTPEEITWAPPRLYGVSLSNCWIVYLESLAPLALCASTIVVINRDSGKIVYRGSANDEG